MDEPLINYRCTPPCNKLLGKYIETETPYAFEVKCNKCHTVNYRGNAISINLVEFRCTAIDPKKSAKAGRDVVCNKLLARVLPGTQLQIKCPRCGAIINTPMDDQHDEDK